MTVAHLHRQTGRAFPFILAAIALAALLAGVWLSTAFGPQDLVARSGQTDDTPNLQSGTLLNPPKALPTFTLEDQNRQPVNPKRLRGHWTLLFFGYTHCPDVCPDTLAKLNLTLKALPDDLRKQTRVLFVSVDPQRDSAQRMGQYVAYFNPDFIGARGSVKQLDKLTGALGVVYVHNKPDENGNYSVNHSAAVMVIDPNAELAALLTNVPHEPKKMAQDLTTIRDYYKDLK